jgi:hypothetical protein
LLNTAGARFCANATPGKASIADEAAVRRRAWRREISAFDTVEAGISKIPVILK